jgi:pyruvate ferredoxin oxidoreductase alpha subunit
MGSVGVPEVYTEARKQCDQALLGSKQVIVEVLEEWAARFDRRYSLIERNGMEGAETLFVTMGSLGETTMTAVEGLNDSGHSIGQVRIRLWRPFPQEEFLEAIQGAKRLIVIDRALSPGSICGPVASEIRSLLYGRQAPEMVNIIAGLGGRDVTVQHFKDMYFGSLSGEFTGNYTIWGVKSHA